MNDDTTDERTNESSDSAERGGGRHQAPPFAENIQGLVDDLLEGVRSFGPVAGIRFPKYDSWETSEAYLLAFDLPGVARDAVTVTTEGEDVVVSGTRTAPDRGEGATLRRGERTFGDFRRSVRMPADVRIDDIKARLEDGVLTVTLPRRVDTAGHKVDIEG